MQRRATYLLVAITAAAVAAVALERPRLTPADPPPSAPTAAQERSEFPAALPRRATMSTPRGDLFAAESEAPAVAPPPAAPVAAPPASPPMPYKFVGHLTRDGVVERFLMKGDAVFPVKEGETLDGAYRVEAVAAEQITLLYIPLGISTRLSLASALDGHGDSGAQTALNIVNTAPSASIPTAHASLQSTSVPTDSAGPIASRAAESPTAATGTRAAHLRRERSQQLPPIGAITP